MTQPPPKPAHHNHHPKPHFSAAPPNSSHIAMVELKHRILTLLTKLADRDTHHIAAIELQNSFVPSLTQSSLPLFLNSLFSFDTASSSFKKDSLYLISFACSLHTPLCSPHLPKVIAFIVNKRLKDPTSSRDSSVRDACKDAVATLAGLYLKNEGSVGVFVRPLIGAMGEQNKGVQMVAAMCLGKVVESAASGEKEVVRELQKGVFGKVVKLINNPSFLGKAALLPVVGSLAQVGAINPLSLESLLQGIHECLGSTDWATRKAAAEALSALAMHSGNLVEDAAASTVTVLEGYRFDKIKPARDSIMEALQLWKNITGKGDATQDKSSDSHEENNQLKENEKNDQKNPACHDDKEPIANSTSTDDSSSKTKGCNIPEKAVVLLKKKSPALSDKELNPEFFQKLERRNSVEVVVPRRYQKSAGQGYEDETGTGLKEVSDQSGQDHSAGINGSSLLRANDNNLNQGFSETTNARGSKAIALNDEKTDPSPRDSCPSHTASVRPNFQNDGSFHSNKGNWIAIQKQLLQLERQQAHLMTMLRDFIGGSHDGMVTLENRVRGLERVVEEMMQNLSTSSARRGTSFALGFEGSARRKFNGFGDYSNLKFARNGDGRGTLGERFSQNEGIAPSMRGRIAPWRSDTSDDWNVTALGSSRYGHGGLRRGANGGTLDGWLARPELDVDNAGGRKAWDKGVIPIRHGEGPSARSVWQASKDEATLEAIRVAGDDGVNSHLSRVAIPELIPEALGEDNTVREQDPVWSAWTNAMDALQVGDSDSAYGEVLFTGDDFLLVKLMDRTGPVIDHLSNEVASELFHAISQFLPEQNLTEVCLSWLQQLLEMVDTGANSIDLPLEIKKELLLSLHEVSSTFEPSEDWEGATPDQLLLHLASAWEIDLRHLEK